MYIDGIFEMFDWLKKKTKPAESAPSPVVAPKEPRTTAPRKKSEKELATERGEPYVAVLNMDVDLDNLHQGAFELDWNDVFVARLIRAGYMMKPEDTDSEIVDRWFQNVCRHVVLETYEQEEAMRNSGIYVRTRDVGNGRSEVS
jgi:hypothetical protein